MRDIELMLKALELKDEKRTGPQLYNIEDSETVAGHSWSTALLVLIYGDEVGVDVDRCLKMAVVHDLAEAETGDFLTRAKEEDLNYDREKKEELEEKFWDDNPELSHLREYWEEYEERETDEAIFVKEMDLLDLCFTALKYEKGNRYDPEDNTERPYRHLDEFFESAEPRLRTALGKRVFRDLKGLYQKEKRSGAEVEEPVYRFVLDSLNLKDEKRTGWELRGVNNPESVASHSWGAAFQILLNCSRENDRLVRMALVHDLEQARAGDIPSRGDEERKTMSTGEKTRREVEAMKELVPEELEEILGLWEEHMDMQTREAKLVEDMEQVDMVLQALKYEKEDRYYPDENPGFSSYPAMDEFFISADENIQAEKGRQLFKKIREEYEKVKEG